MTKRVVASALLALMVAACGGDGRIMEPAAGKNLTPLAAIGVDPVSGASIETDQDDYFPGEKVHLTGRGWAPDEVVHLNMTEDPERHPDVSMDITADSTGAFSQHFYDVADHDLGVTFTLTATGQTSGSVAVATFTDGTYQIGILTSPAGLISSISFIVRNECNTSNGANAGTLAVGGSARIGVNGSKVLVFKVPVVPGRTYLGTTTDLSFTTVGDSLCVTGGVTPGNDDVNKNLTLNYSGGAANSPPTLTGVPTTAQSIPEQQAYSFDANATDTDDPAQTLTFSIVGTLPTGATFDVSTGIFSWTPGEDQGGTSASFTVRVSDGIADVDQAVTLNVTEGNAPPSLTDVPSSPQTIPELSEYTFDANATDADLPAPTLTFSLVGAPAGAAIDPSTGVFSWTPTEAQGPGSYPFTVRVTDGTANTDVALTLDVTEVNALPVLSNVPAVASIPEQVEYSFDANATDSDLPAQTLAFSLVGAPSAASINATSGVFKWTPAEADGPGSFTFTVRVSDGTGHADQSVTLTVTEVNVAPAISAPSNVSLPWGTTPSVPKATATDADLPKNTLVFTLVSGPSWVTVGTDGSITLGATTAADIATHTVTVRVDDNGSPSLGDQESFTITVTARPTTLTYDGRTAGQYSDRSTLSATLTDDVAAGAPLSGRTIDFYFAGTKVGSGTTDASGKASFDYPIAQASGQSSVQAKFAAAAGYAGSNSSLTNFTVGREEAEGSTITNTGAAQVGVSSFSVTIGIREARFGNGNEPTPNDGQLAGNIANVTSVTAMASPVAGSGNINGSCQAGAVSGSGYGGVRSFTCTFSSATPIPVDVYTLTFTVGGDYYSGTYEDVFSIWDPAAGFATGGGSFFIGDDRVSFGFSFTATKGKTTPRGGLVVVRHLAGGGVCRVKSNSMNAPAVSGNTATLGGKGNYNCVVNNVTTVSQGNINIIAVAEDNGTSGAGVDRFRVQAMDQLNIGALVLLAGGNIQVPQPQRK